MFASLRRVLSDTTPGMRPKIIGVSALLIAINLLLWGAALYTASLYPAFLAFAVAAYLLGLRHAVDADHIATIDNVTRKLMQEDKRPVGVGFFFSLGHSTIVIALSIVIALTATAIQQNFPGLQNIGGLIGTFISVFFLFVISFMNFLFMLYIFF